MIRRIHWKIHPIFHSLFLMILAIQCVQAEESIHKSDVYQKAVEKFADIVLDKGRDTFGDKKTPLFVDGLHIETLQPAIWKKDGENWIISNFASQQPLLRTLDGLTALNGKIKYQKAAEDATRYALEHLQSPNGLLYWGGHLAWDLDQERPVGQYQDTHELKGHQPYYRLMWRVNPAATKKLLEGIWATHILDWSRMDYNRHASVKKPAQPQWDHEFDNDIEVPFPAKGNNLSFVNVTPPFLHSGIMLAILDQNTDALRWSRRLIYRWQQAEHPETGLCGGQLSYREHDRAQDALGHVHPTINEAKIVASYHQTCRYHHLTLAQMQAGEQLKSAGGKYAEVGENFIQWALDDLKVYAKYSYDSKSGQFISLMIDGTPIQWQESKSGYYVPSSFAPRNPDGYIFWSYAMAYRLSKNKDHWEMVHQLGKEFGLGNLGEIDNESKSIRFETNSDDWRLIYALLELHHATNNPEMLSLACRIGDNILNTQHETGLFPHTNRDYARTGDEIPLALLHLAAVIEGKEESLPAPIYDSRFFHCEYHGHLEPHQQKRADKRTYDHLVFYGR